MSRPVYRHVSSRSFDDDLDYHIQINAPLELCLHGDELDNWKTNGMGERIQKLLDTYSPKMCLHGPIFAWDPASYDKAMRDTCWNRTMALFEVVDLVKPETIVLHSSYIHQVRQFDQKNWRDMTIDFYQRLLEHLPNNGCRIAIENIFEQHPFLLAEVIHGINDERVGHCFDIGHFNMFQKGFKADNWLKPFGDKLYHLHLHDNYGQEDLHLPPGTAGIDFAPLLETLASYSHHFTATVEGKNIDDNDTAVEWVQTHIKGFETL